MYFRNTTKQKLLTIKDDFAYLSRILENGDLAFEFRYEISQSDVIQRQAQKVTVSIETRNISPKKLLGATQRGNVDTRSLVTNIRTATIDAKSTQQQQAKYLVISRDSDVTAHINNDVVSQLRARVSTANVPSFVKSQLTLVSTSDVKQSNDPQPVLQRVSNSLLVPDVQSAMSSSIVSDPRSFMQDMLTRQGLDPSYVMELTNRSSSARSTYEGLSNASKAVELVTDPATQFLNGRLFSSTTIVPPTTTEQLPNTDLVHVIKTVIDDTLDVPVNVIIPKSSLLVDGAAVTQVLVKFELIESSTGMPIDSTSRILDLTKHVQVYRTPKKAPIVKVSTSVTSTRSHLEIRQVDPGATDVEVYKKSFWISSPEIENYTLVGKYALNSRNQPLYLTVDMPTTSPIVYRVVPIGAQSTRSNEYTNVIVKPARYSPLKSIALTAKQVDNGIEVAVRNIPWNVVAIHVLKWNMTTFDSSSTIVNDDAMFIDAATRRADIVTTIDSDVNQNNTYKYIARLIYKDGLTKDCGEALLDFVQPSPQQVDTTIANLKVNDVGNLNVTFDIMTSVLATDMDMIKEMLENQGLTDFFTGDVAAQRDQLANLVAHSIDRIDLTTGEREGFGTLTTKKFDDAALRKNKSIKPLDTEHSYRYEIYPLLRAPETVFDAFRKTVTDDTTKKPYTFSPAKFLHPITLNKGTIVSSAGASQRYGKDQMAYGIVGDVTTVDVSFAITASQVKKALATNFDRHHNIISWSNIGDLRKVDSFLVFKQVHGMRTALGKTHAFFHNNINCQYVHAITPDDVGVIQYVIVPMMNDYSMGSETVTNSLVIQGAP